MVEQRSPKPRVVGSRPSSPASEMRKHFATAFAEICFNHGSVVQLVRTPACHAGGRGFEPHPSRQRKFYTTYADLAHLVERDLAKVEVAGSSPVIRSIRRHSQAVRQRSATPSPPVQIWVAPPKPRGRKFLGLTFYLFLITSYLNFLGALESNK